MAKLLDRLAGNRAFRHFLAFLVGAFIGVVVSFTVNCTLVEISINGFFAVYFGVLFILIAALILWRVRTGDHPKPCLLVSFAALVLVAGILCFFLEQRWFLSTAPAWKIPLYAILGVAVCFALLFSIIDLINYCCGVFQSENSRPLVESETQVYLVVVTAVIMGAVFGFIFGLLDVEDEQLSHLRLALLREESYCYPIGALVGGAAAAINQSLRERQDQYRFEPMQDDDLDEDY